MDNLKAGWELDALVAEKVMGWKRTPEEDRTRAAVLGGRLCIWKHPEWADTTPTYSTDIAAAWEVVETLEADGYHVRYQTSGLTGGRRVTIDRPDESSAIYGYAEADTAPLAICKAALKAVEKHL